MVFENGANSQQIEYLRRRLGIWHDQLDFESEEGSWYLNKGNTFDQMKQVVNLANRQVSSQSPQERRQKLIRKIDETLRHIEARSYRIRNP